MLSRASVARVAWSLGALFAVLVVNGARAQVCHRATLSAPDAAAQDQLGLAVAVDGRYALVGAYLDDTASGGAGGNAGAAYLYEAQSGALLAELHATDAHFGDRFGVSVAVSGRLGLIGAYLDSTASSMAGAAYVFDLDTRQQLFELLAPDAETDDQLGGAVALRGSLALIGAGGDDHPGEGSGSAYLFDASTGQLIRKLSPVSATGNTTFGASVALTDAFAVVGAPGPSSGWTYVFDVFSGQQLLRIRSSHTSPQSRFGSSVAVDAGLLLVGAPHQYFNGVHTGAAYLFDVTTGEELDRLLARKPTPYDNFGWSVALRGDVAIVGAIWEEQRGCAFLFQLPSGRPLARLTAPAGALNDYLGYSVGIDATHAIVGAPLDDGTHVNTGSAELFDLTCPHGLASCLGDGTDGACPCANAGTTGRGCDNAAGTGGVRLWATGLPGTAGFFLHGEGFPPAARPAVVVLRSAASPTPPAPFGDGLLCLGTPFERVAAAPAAGGVSAHHIDASGPPGPARFQLAYRSAGSFCSPAAFNLSSSLELSWP